ncbi:polysaccharide biosynthesis/export family protein [Aliiroseovarius sp. YM-037]|uniref:polysaccharide biosynthesis/export family protein n=1 Tax=Aliiroseovarius sp. YM-037 TaxID=3341728 RepID=UPI003A812878
MKPFFTLLVTLFILGVVGTSATAQDNYRVRSGDTLRIEVLEDATLNQEALVRPDGNISVPFAGSVTAGGRTIDQIRNDVAARLEPNFAARPNVFVTLSSLAVPREPRPPRTIDVYVIGEAATPGKYEVNRGTTLLQFFAEMGGFSRFAATKRIVLRRNSSGQENVYRFNYDAILSGTGRGASTVMSDGDVIVIPQRRLFE